jgi:outer membrane protein/protease secretion system outer membrane protein
MRISTLFAVGCLGLANAAQAVDFVSAYEAAVRHDRQLEAARAGRDGAAEQVPMAESRKRFNVGFSSSRTWVQQDRTDNGISFAQQNYPTRNDTLQARLPLLNRRVDAGIDRAVAQVKGADAKLQGVDQELVNRLLDAYLSQLLANDQLAQLATQRLSAESRLTAAQNALKAGVGTRTDIDEIRAQLDVIFARTLKAEQDQLTAQAELEVITGLTGQGKLRHRLDVQAFVPEQFDPKVLEDWVRKAQQQNAVLNQRRAELEAARASQLDARAERYPSLDLVLQASKSSSESSFFVNSQTNNRVLGLQLTVPIYQGGYLSARNRQADAAIREAESLVAASEDAIRVEVQKAFYAIQEGIKRIRALEATARSAEQLVRATRMSATAGQRSTLDVLNAEQRAAETVLQLAQVRYEMLISWARLQALSGEVDRSVVSRIGAVLTASAQQQ